MLGSGEYKVGVASPGGWGKRLSGREQRADHNLCVPVVTARWMPPEKTLSVSAEPC